MGRTVEENLPRNPQEAAAIPDPGPQVNRVIVLKEGTGQQVDTQPKCIAPAGDPWQRDGN